MSLPLRGALAATLLLVLPAVGARAEVVEDPLHGQCSAGCPENTGHTATPITEGGGGLANFGFSANPNGNQGLLDIFILVPDNDLTGVLPQFNGTGLTGNVTPTQVFNTTVGGGPLGADYNSGDLSTFVNLTPASPSNPIASLLGPTQTLDPGANGFDVFELLAGLQTLNGPSGPLTDLYNEVGNDLPLGTTIVAFLSQTNGQYVATAPSGQLQIDARAPDPAPLPATLPLFASGLGALGLLGWRRKRKTQAVA